ncbi:hypothetical protein ACVILK_000906 [Bradyrhizobium embrapense]
MPLSRSAQQSSSYARQRLGSRGLSSASRSFHHPRGVFRLRRKGAWLRHCAHFPRRRPNAYDSSHHQHGALSPLYDSVIGGVRLFTMDGERTREPALEPRKIGIVFLGPPIHVDLLHVPPFIGEQPYIDVTVRSVIAADPAPEQVNGRDIGGRLDPVRKDASERGDQGSSPPHFSVEAVWTGVEKTKGRCRTGDDGARLRGSRARALDPPRWARQLRGHGGPVLPTPAFCFSAERLHPRCSFPEWNENARLSTIHTMRCVKPARRSTSSLIRRFGILTANPRGSLIPSWEQSSTTIDGWNASAGRTRRGQYCPRAGARCSSWPISTAPRSSKRHATVIATQTLAAP